MSDASPLGPLIDVTETTRELFAAPDDLEKVANIQSALDESASSRTAELEAQRDVLRALGRQYEAQKAVAARSASGSTTDSQLAALDNQKYALGKLIGDLEQAMAGSEAQLARVKLQAVAAERNEFKDQAEVNGEILRLKVYRDLGFTPVADQGTALDKILVRSSASTDANIVPCDPARTGFACTNLLWELAS